MSLSEALAAHQVDEDLVRIVAKGEAAGDLPAWLRSIDGVLQHLQDTGELVLTTPGHGVVGFGTHFDPGANRAILTRVEVKTDEDGRPILPPR